MKLGPGALKPWPPWPACSSRPVALCTKRIDCKFCYTINKVMSVFLVFFVGVG